MTGTEFDCLDRIEVASIDELRALQLERLQWSIAHSYKNVDHYRRSYDEHGVGPNDLNAHSDLSKFPLLTKKDMRASYPFELFATPMEEVVRLHASSGTTGNPVVVGHTKNDLDMWTNVAARCLYAIGARANDFLHMGLIYGLKTGAFPIHYGAEKIGCTVVPVSSDTPEKHVKYLLDFKPRFFMSNRSQVLTILDCFETMGIDPKAASVEIGIFGGEAGSAAMRKFVAERFGIKAVEAYGLTEVCGAGMAIQTPDSEEGVTLWEDLFYPEIINPVSGEVLPEGEYGELVITSLAKEASPIIRYRTKDITCLLPPAERAMRRLAPLKGRADDIVVVDNKSLYPLDIEQEVISDQRVRPFYQIVVSKVNGEDKVSVKVEMTDDLMASGHETQAACQLDLTSAIKNASGFEVEIELASPMTFPRSSAKSVRFIDQR